MTITIIQGGPRAQSQTATVATFLAAQLNANSEVSKVEFLDIREYNFPVYGAGAPTKRASMSSVQLFNTLTVS